MKQLTGLFFAAIFIACPMAAAAQDEQPPISDEVRAKAASLRDRAMEGTDAYELVASITTEVGARLAGTPGDRAAIAWALLKLRELGFENVRAEPVAVPRWIRGTIEARVVAPYPQPLVATALGGSIGTGEEGIEAPVVVAEDLEALKAMDPDEIKGKIVYIGDRMERHRDGSGYGEAVQKRVNGAVEAARLGARAVLIRSAGTSRTRIAHTGMTRYRDNVRRIPAAAVSNEDANMIERQVASGKEVIVHLKLTSRNLPDTESANVIGEIPGTTQGAGIVLLGAHLDSWDVGTGAVDDGAGIAIVTEAARLIGELDDRPRRTIRVVLFANEEFGLSGARQYVEAHGDEIGEHVLALEADFGAGPVWRLDSNVPEDRLPLVGEMHSLVKPLGVSLGPNESGGGADIGELRKLGVPVLGPRQDGTNYFDWHHTVADTLNKVDGDALNQNVAVYATLAYLAAAVEVDFGRLPSEEKEGEEETDEE